MIKPITVTAPPRNEPRAPSQSVGIPGTGIASTVPACATFFAAAGHGVKIIGSEVGSPVFEIDAAEGLSDEDAVRRIAEIAEAAFGNDGCSDRKLKFRVNGTEGLYFEGAASRDDYALYRQGRISRAELARRFELTSLETLASVKLKLKRAREDGDHGFAAVLARQWIDKEPGNLAAQLILANVELDKEDYQDAIAAYENVLLSNPSNFIAWFNLAFAKRESGVFGEAIAIYRKLLADYESYEYRYLLPEDVRMHLADALWGDGRVEEARSELDAFPDKSLEAWIVLDANVKRAQKKYAEARKALEAFLKARPDADVPRFNLVLTCLDLRDKDGARREFAVLEKANPALAGEISFLPVFTATAASKPSRAPE